MDLTILWISKHRIIPEAGRIRAQASFQVHSEIVSIEAKVLVENGIQAVSSSAGQSLDGA
jgi:hypothetical protein